MKVLRYFTSTHCNILICNSNQEYFTFLLIKLHFYIALAEAYHYFTKSRTFPTIFHREGKNKYSFEFNLYAYYHPHFDHNLQLKVQNLFCPTLISICILVDEKSLCTCLCMRGDSALRDGTVFSAAEQRSVCYLIWSRRAKRQFLSYNRLTRHQCSPYLTEISKICSANICSSINIPGN
jgi:hypothetical protein